MKYNKILWLIFSISLLGLAGCQKYLEEVHPYQVTTDFLYNTPEGLQSAVNGLYAMERAQVDDNESNDFGLGAFGRWFGASPLGTSPRSDAHHLARQI